MDEQEIRTKSAPEVERDGSRLPRGLRGVDQDGVLAGCTLKQRGGQVLVLPTLRSAGGFHEGAPDRTAFGELAAGASFFCQALA
jgi:hypothetical protein